MAEPPLLTDDRDGIVVLTLHRPAVRNAVDTTLMDALGAAADELAKKQDLVAVVLTGTGERAFCSGGDLRWMKTLSTPDQGVAMSRRMQDALSRFAALPVPVIAAVGGAAVGGGAEVALAADLRFVEEHAVFTFKQGRMGLAPGWGGAARLRRAVGYARAFEWLVGGATVDAATALATGLADRVVATGRAVDEAVAFGEQVRELSPRSVATMKAMLTTLHPDPDREARLFGDVWASPEHQEAVDAFFAKRPAVLRGTK